MLYLRNIDNLRKKAEYAPYFQLFYELVCIWLSDSLEININLIQFTSAVEKYQITRKNMYNFDKKGFMIGVGIIAIQVITLEEMRSGKIIEASQDRNREWVSLLPAVCAVALKIPPVLIYQEESWDLQDSRVEDVGDDTVYFVAIPTRWSNNGIKRQ